MGSVFCECFRYMCVCGVVDRCSRFRSKERVVVVVWERRLMVVGDVFESI